MATAGEIPRQGTVGSTKQPGRPRLLVTDDRPGMTQVILQALGGRYVCEFASGLEQAGEMLAANSFDIALCDIEAGGEAALALAKKVSSGELDTAVILITAKDSPEQADEAFELGAYGYLVKPPWPGQLLITVMNALRRRELEIAERKHGQNLEDRRQTIIDMAPIPIYAKDLSGRYIVANEIADELAGLQPGELVGLSDKDLLAPEDLEIGTYSDRKVRESEAVYEVEDTLEVGGAKRTFKTIRFPLLDEEGKVDAVGGISVDLTDEREGGRLRDELAATQQKAIEELQLSRLETIQGLAKAIDLHDSPTAEHVQRMAAVAGYLGSKLGFDVRRVELLRAAAPMHDVGKIGTPAELLRKPGPLSEDERTEMMRHTVVGHEIFSQFESELSRLAATIALTHHERYDGSGYPQGLGGAEIPLEGRITAVADVFDALLSDRSYRPAMSIDETVAIIREGRGSHFDPRIADLLLDHLDDVIALRNCPDLTVKRSRLQPPAEIQGSDAGRAQPLGARPNDSQRGIDRAAEAISRSYGDALRAADGAAAERLAFEALHEGVSVATLYERVIAPAMWRIGSLWEEGAITVADEHLATALTHRVMAGVFGSNFGRAAFRPGRILLAAAEANTTRLVCAWPPTSSSWLATR